MTRSCSRRHLTAIFLRFAPPYSVNQKRKTHRIWATSFWGPGPFTEEPMVSLPTAVQDPTIDSFSTCRKYELVNCMQVRATSPEPLPRAAQMYMPTTDHHGECRPLRADGRPKPTPGTTSRRLRSSSSPWMPQSIANAPVGTAGQQVVGEAVRAKLRQKPLPVWYWYGHHLPVAWYNCRSIHLCNILLIRLRTIL